ncbi:hypothetical protein UlMin_033310 [Ulmus minor]
MDIVLERKLPFRWCLLRSPEQKELTWAFKAKYPALAYKVDPIGFTVPEADLHPYCTSVLNIVTLPCCVSGTFSIWSGLLAPVHSFATDDTRGIFLWWLFLLRTDI